MTPTKFLSFFTAAVTATLFSAAGFMTSTAAEAATMSVQVSLAPAANSFTFLNDFKAGEPFDVAGVTFKTTHTQAPASIPTGADNIFVSSSTGETSDQTITIPVNITTKVAEFDTLISSLAGTAGITDGRLTFEDSLGNHLSFDLTEGVNIRNFNLAQPGNQDASGVAGTRLINDGHFRLDDQRFDISALANLKDIQFTRLAGNDEDLVMFGATAVGVAPVLATPLPAALPMFGTVLGGMGALARRRRRGRKSVA